MMTTKPSNTTTSLSRLALWSCCFLSLFQILTTIAPNPKSEHLYSMEQLELLKQDFLKSTADLPSMQHMLNLTYDDGSLMSASYVPLYWTRKLHMGQIPVCLWLSIAPIQIFGSTIRTKYPQTHRTLGYVFFTMSASISIGLTFLIGSGKVFGYPHWLAMLLNTFKLIYLAVSGAFALTYAMRRKIAEHQIWITRHVAMGYSVSFQRVLLSVVGPVLHAYGFLELPTSRDRQIWYNCTTTFALLPVILVEASMIISSKRETTIKNKAA